MRWPGMLVALQILAVALAAVAMSLSLAHALESPGKMRLAKDAYMTVQPIYYPGFTVGGFAEPISLAVLLALLFLTPSGTVSFWLTLGSFLAMAITHGTYWLLTHPVNNFWLKDSALKGASAKFFETGASGSSSDWTALRNRWEMSHIVRAAVSFAGFLMIVTAAAI